MRRFLTAALILAATCRAAPLLAQEDVFDPNKEYELEIVTWTADEKTEGLTWEWLVKEYQRFRPNVRVHKTIQSVRTYEAWATTQFKSGFAPDIMQAFSRYGKQWGAEQGLLIPMRKYLNQPNPLDPRDKTKYPTWMSCLYEELLEINADPYYGEIWTIPISLNTQRFYYNKNIFDRFDLEVPQTFSELGDVCRQIREKSAGEIEPIAMNKFGAWLDYLGSGVNSHLIDKYDLIKKDGSVELNEVLVAALRGMWDANTEEMYSYHKLMKKMHDEGWFQPGWDGFDTNQADNLFTNGKAAITREGYWMQEGFEQRIAGAFEFSVMREPYIDKAFTGKDVGRRLEMMASYGSELAVTRKCAERGRLAAALDFLRFMTSPDVAKQVAMRRGAMPSTRDLDKFFPPKILAFKPEVGGRPGGPVFYNLNIRMQDCFTQVIPLYVSGKKELPWIKSFMSQFHNRLVELERNVQVEGTRRGVFTAAQLYARFIYDQEQLRRRIDQAPERIELAQELDDKLTLMSMTVDKLKDTEDFVVALIDAAYPDQGADGYRRVPLINTRQAAAAQKVGALLLVGSFVWLVVFLTRKGRLHRLLGFPEKGIYLFILPTMIFVVAFSYYPALSGIYHAFTRWDGVTVDEFIGLANFKELLSDQVLITATVNLVWMMAAFLFKVFPPLLIAVVLYHVASERLRYYFRVMFVLPLIVPGIVYWMVWKLLYQPAPSGVFNSILVPMEHWLQGRGFDVTLAYNWLADPRTALGAVIFLGFPWVNTLGVLIYLAGLENIDPNLFEAAEIDGAGALKKLWYVELPLLMRQVRLMVVLGMIATIQGFGTILFLTQGGPAYSTTVPGYQMYDEAFKLGRMGYASAIGLVMFVVILLATMTVGKTVKAQD